MDTSDRFLGCIVGGAIGDALGSAFENIAKVDDAATTYYPFGKPEINKPVWRITDDTQLTLATCEAITENEILDAEIFAHKYLDFYKSGKITGIGASTLKALQELEVGGHWSLVGRKGEYAAGNGAAMRVAPLGFEPKISKSLIKDICNITHHNDEAYIGALCIVIAIKSIINKTWTGKENLLQIIIDKIPDTRMRDRLIEIDNIQCDLSKIGDFGTNGYVVNSVPLAIGYASQVNKIGIQSMFEQIVQLGGDTDTNCSIAGQIAGTLIGIKEIPMELTNKLKALNEFP
ncbi:MAG: ADP-ribosylglycohydrolase family protein [Leeuwenhoekiella sp.]